ncbi:DUF305 domain-containing protein [Nocardioides sp. CFH 31398]|uniref:DUF305 domain-containing protein n=1 Tax=Nocardioides sp. CFH 31398 TaxID=2919579 RepID=UPI001F070977|nr:DUF305 domain-containing protein [Nocardioides sp. CFH 31398]MCH1866106.1 DUF305 domain-containing protein [Nocardioides sp. CFH 31398]
MEIRTRYSTRATVVLCVAATLGLSGCGGAEESSDASPSSATSSAAPEGGQDDGSGVRVIRPGEPGEEAEEGPTELEPNEYSDADVEFMTMMIPHHRQALVISDLAADRAESQGVRRIASRIRDAQAPEIQAMARWLEARGQEVPAPEDDSVDMAEEMSGMGMGDMGMLTSDELLELVEADGPEFDRLFLDAMIGHHQGAVDMTEDLQADGSDIQALEMAADINIGQTAEIGRMEDVKDSL